MDRVGEQSCFCRERGKSASFFFLFVLSFNQSELFGKEVVNGQISKIDIHRQLSGAGGTPRTVGTWLSNTADIRSEQVVKIANSR